MIDIATQEKIVNIYMKEIHPNKEHINDLN